MPIEKQFSVFVQNKVGSLGDLCVSLSDADVNIRAVSIIDDLDWGIVRIIVDDDEKTRIILHDLGLMFGEGSVLTVELENHPGALAEMARKLAGKKINIVQAQATATGEKTIMVLSTTDDRKAAGLLGG